MTKNVPKRLIFNWFLHVLSQRPLTETAQPMHLGAGHLERAEAKRDRKRLAWAKRCALAPVQPAFIERVSRAPRAIRSHGVVAAIASTAGIAVGGSGRR